MKTLLVLFILGAVGCASPSVRERERQVEATVEVKYDLDALRAFLERTVAEHPTHDGMTLPKTVVEGWRFRSDSSMRSGVWIFHEQPEKGGDRFVLHSQRGDWYFAIEAKRLAKDSFELVQIYALTPIT